MRSIVPRKWVSYKSGIAEGFLKWRYAILVPFTETYWVGTVCADMVV